MRRMYVGEVSVCSHIEHDMFISHEVKSAKKPYVPLGRLERFILQNVCFVCVCVWEHEWGRSRVSFFLFCVLLRNASMESFI